MRTRLGDEAFGTAAREGSGLSLEDVLPLATGADGASAPPPTPAPKLARSTVMAPASETPEEN